MRRVKELAQLVLEPEPDQTIAVTELRCTEPGCPPIETVVVLLAPGRAPRQLKIHKPVGDVTEEDLRGALGTEHAHP